MKLVLPLICYIFIRYLYVRMMDNVKIATIGGKKRGNDHSMLEEWMILQNDNSSNIHYDLNCDIACRSAIMLAHANADKINKYDEYVRNGQVRLSMDNYSPVYPGMSNMTMYEPV
jgi:hypothetical protein